MTAFPSFIITDQSRMSADGGRLTVRATNGALKVRNMYPAIKRTFDVVLYLSASEKATLDSFYSTEKLNAVTLTWPDGNAYTVVFTEAPEYALQIGGWYYATVRFGEQ